MRKALTPLLGLVLVASAALADGSAPTASALVVTQPLTFHDMVETLAGYGTVNGQPGQVFNLALPSAGRIDAVLVSVGQVVTKGQPLLSVAADAGAHLAYTQAENALAFARRDVDRERALRIQQLATNAQFDAAQHALQDAEQALATQKALGAGAASTTVRAPVTGVVTALTVAPGDRPAAGLSLGQVTSGNALQVRLGLLPGDSRQVRTGMKVRLYDVFDPAQQIDGIVSAVGGVVDVASQRVDVLVRLNGALPPGTHVKGVITLARHKTLAVPRQAVLSDENGIYVFQVLNGRAHRVNVSKGGESDGLIAIGGPLTANARIVVLGNYELTDGMAVREGTP